MRRCGSSTARGGLVVVPRAGERLTVPARRRAQRQVGSRAASWAGRGRRSCSSRPGRRATRRWPSGSRRHRAERPAAWIDGRGAVDAARGARRRADGDGRRRLPLALGREPVRGGLGRRGRRGRRRAEAARAAGRAAGRSRSRNEVGLGIVPATPLGRALPRRARARERDLGRSGRGARASSCRARAALEGSMLSWPTAAASTAPDAAWPAGREDEAARQPRPARGSRRARRRDPRDGAPGRLRGRDRRRGRRPRRRRGRASAPTRRR